MQWILAALWYVFNKCENIWRSLITETLPFNWLKLCFIILYNTTLRLNALVWHSETIKWLQWNNALGWKRGQYSEAEFCGVYEKFTEYTYIKNKEHRFWVCCSDRQLNKDWNRRVIVGRNCKYSIWLFGTKSVDFLFWGGYLIIFRIWEVCIRNLRALRYLGHLQGMSDSRPRIC